MNLKKIKRLFVEFMSQFEDNDLQVLMGFLDFVVDEYQQNPMNLVGKLKSSELSLTLTFV